MAKVRRRRLTLGQKVTMAFAAIAFLAFAAWLYGGSYLRQRDFAFSRAAKTDVQGPPCPQLTDIEFARRRLSAAKATNFEGVVFARQLGHMDCSALRYGAGWGTETYPVCQFTGPNALSVTTDKGKWFFAPGPGQPATVAVPHGEAHCVMGSNFRLSR